MRSDPILRLDHSKATHAALDGCCHLHYAYSLLITTSHAHVIVILHKSATGRCMAMQLLPKPILTYRFRCVPGGIGSRIAPQFCNLKRVLLKRASSSPTSRIVIADMVICSTLHMHELDPGHPNTRLDPTECPTGISMTNCSTASPVSVVSAMTIRSSSLRSKAS